jgi:hypothetical protein
VSEVGYSISAELHDKLEKNRRENRLCNGAARSRAGCSTRATTVVVTESWVYRIGEGKSTRHEVRMCTRHARQTPIGFSGVNFRVVDLVLI